MKLRLSYNVKMSIAVQLSRDKDTAQYFLSLNDICRLHNCKWESNERIPGFVEVQEEVNVNE